jgi:hypothetical protein
MAVLDEGKPQEPLKKERLETRLDADPHAVQTQTLARLSTKDLEQYIPSFPYLLCFLGGIFFCLTWQWLGQPNSQTCALPVTFQLRLSKGGNETDASLTGFGCASCEDSRSGHRVGVLLCSP